MLQRRLLVFFAVALAVALALWVWLPAKDATLRGPGDNGPAHPTPPTSGSVSPGPDPGPTAPAATAVPDNVDVPRRATTATAGVAVTMSAPQKITVGETNDLVVGIGPNSGLGKVDFTLQFDPNVLQVRTGTDGEWTTGVGYDAGSFETEISEAGDRARVRVTAARGRARMAGASVAVMQFQAVGPGTTDIVITDVVLQDLSGTRIASSVAAPNLQISVEPVPPQADALRHRRGAAVETPPNTGNESN